MQFVIEAQDSGKTVRDFLRKEGISAALLAKLKRHEQGILLDGTRVTVRAVLQTGNVLALAIEDEVGNEKILPLAKEVETVLETAELVAVNKPPFMPTHPSHGHFDDTLANALVWRYGECFRPRFINRLDRNTSGLVLVAKHHLAATKLARAMAAGEIKKVYYAVACGVITAETVLKTGIRRQNDSVLTREVCAVGEGDLAVTYIKPLANNGKLTLLRLAPETGRTHQLRVHMAHLGAPLLGDEFYGTPDGDFPRHALHAAKMTFPHPVTGDICTLTAPIAPDMAALIGKEFGSEVLALVEEN